MEIKTVRCSVCNHQEVNQVNERLIAGASIRELAGQYNLGRESVQRHRQNHLPKLLVKAKAMQEVDAADRLLDRINDLYDRAMTLLKKAED